jgi:ribonuclease Z
VLLSVSDILVSHAHMDHFIGFDPWLRVVLGREKTVRLFGPEGFIDRVAHKLAGYSWNLVAGYPTDLVLHVAEVAADGGGRRATFRMKEAFRREEAGSVRFAGGVLFEEPGLRVRAEILDHDLPSLAFALEEARHVNIRKSDLLARGLAVGPWLRTLREAALSDAAEATPIAVRWQEETGSRPDALPFGELRPLLTIVPGQKLTYVVDAAPTAENAERILSLARDADILFIETPFLEADLAMARRKRHLTAAFAGRVARAAGVRQLVPFHFSARYAGSEARLAEEAARSFAGHG